MALVPTFFTDPEVDALTIVPVSVIYWNEILDALQEDVDFCRHPGRFPQ